MQNDFNQQLTLPSGTTYSDVYEVKDDARRVDTSVNTLAISGVGATLNVTLQFSQDKATWQDAETYAAATTTGLRSAQNNNPLYYMRFKMVVTGTTPSVSVKLFAMGYEDDAVTSFSTPAAVTVNQTTAAAIFGSPTPVVHQVWVQADINNTDVIRVGDSNCSATRGIQLQAGAGYVFEVSDAASIFACSPSAGQKLNVEIR